MRPFRPDLLACFLFGLSLTFRCSSCGMAQSAIKDREMTQSELRTRVAWAFANFVHQQLQLHAAHKYLQALQLDANTLTLDLPFTYEVCH